jgi:glycosyltransferase involved in cell wall biosynthesis
VKALAEAMCEVIDNTALREKLIAGGYRYVDLHSWDRRKHEYLNLVDTLSTQIFSSTGSRAIEPVHADR